MFIVNAVVISLILLFSVISVLAMCARCRKRRNKEAYKKYKERAKDGPLRTVSQNFTRYLTRDPKKCESVISWGSISFNSDSVSHVSLSSVQVSDTELSRSNSQTAQQEEASQSSGNLFSVLGSSTSMNSETSGREGESISEGVTSDAESRCWT